jgi:hypothetical protein
MKIGIVQTGAIGDIVIALPIAKWYVDRGYEVFWPVDDRHISFLQPAAPYVRFVPVHTQLFGTNTAQYFLLVPFQLLANAGVKDIFTLYSHLSGVDLGHANLSNSLKFDEYKYAVAGVPFDEKWKLQIERNRANEDFILEKIGAHERYSIIHEVGGAGSNYQREVGAHIQSEEYGKHVKIEPVTSSPFDWIGAFEKAVHIACIDSLHANVVEQLHISTPKSLFLRSPCNFTPVFKNGWKFY